jgi:hypothetical protein
MQNAERTTATARRTTGILPRMALPLLVRLVWPLPGATHGRAEGHRPSGGVRRRESPLRVAWSYHRRFVVQVPDLPLPDDIIQKILIAVFGSGATIVGVFKVVNAIWAWIKLGKTGVRVGSRSIAAIQRVAVRLYEMRPIAILFGIITSITMFLLQALWLGVSYLIGNGLTWAFVGKPGMRGEPQGRPPPR